MAARRNAAPAPGDVLLVTGAESFLAERAVRSAIATVTEAGDRLEVTELAAAEVDGGSQGRHVGRGTHLLTLS